MKTIKAFDARRLAAGSLRGNSLGLSGSADGAGGDNCPWYDPTCWGTASGTNTDPGTALTPLEPDVAAPEDDGSCTNLPESPSGLDCRYGFAPKQRTTNTGKTCYTCAEVPTQPGGACPPGMLPNPVTKGCSNPSDGGGVPDVVNGKIVCPGGGTPNKITGICSVVPATSGGGAKPRPQPTPTPAPGPAAAGVDTNLLLIAGAVLVAGIGGMYIYKKNKRAGA